jgi:hypothetical protein
MLLLLLPLLPLLLGCAMLRLKLLHVRRRL